mmetsp:Transcript_20199/g.56021  ORF Transcript_20199/g.56021 Transcript_20199/m.56021 type:complete len:396 (+) Transcript_20199:389-1576(+)
MTPASLTEICIKEEVLKMVNKIRVKSAYVDKVSGRYFDNVTPVSTWIEPDTRVADILPVLTKRFWAALASELLDDDDGNSPQPDMIKAVSITYEGSLVLKDDILYDVLADSPTGADSAEREKVILVGVKGASDYLPAKTGDGHILCTAKQQWKNLPVACQSQRSVPQHQQLSMPLMGNDMISQYQPLNQGTPVSNHKPSMPGLMSGAQGPQDTGLPSLDGSVWTNMNLQGIHLLQPGHDGSGVLAPPAPVPSVPSENVLGKRQAELDAEERGPCPLPFLRDVSTVTELYDRWETGVDGEKPLKKLMPSHYRQYRTRYHEIKNFILKVIERAEKGEAGGNPREVAMAMQLELESMKTNHGSRMGLPTFVRKVAAEHVQQTRGGPGRSRSKDNLPDP